MDDSPSETDVYCSEFRAISIRWHLSGREKIAVEYRPMPLSKRQRLEEDSKENEENLDIPEDDRRDIPKAEKVTWTPVRLVELGIPKDDDGSMSEDQGGLGGRHESSAQDVMSPESTNKKKKKKKKRTRGKTSEQKRQRQRRAPQPGLTIAQSKHEKIVRGLKLRTHFLRAEGFSLNENSRVTSTGWHGLPPPKDELQELIARHRDGSISEQLSHFHRVPFDPTSKSPTALLDCMNRAFGIRTTTAHFLAKLGSQLYDAMYQLLGPTLANDSVKRDCELKNPRGDHFQGLMGHQRPYHDTIILVKWHKDNLKAVEAFLDTPCVQELIAWVNWFLRTFFPNVAERYQRCADWHKAKYGVSPLFGLFWNFCINGIFPDQLRIHTVPHGDPKNVIGACVIFVYVKPGFEFDHKTRSWFVIFEAGVIIELPPWVAFFYPSSLFIHFNCDISGTSTPSVYSGDSLQ
ncbi:hypothetical protein MD484_g7727, partial [Candolleomyces efflorescens]